MRSPTRRATSTWTIVVDHDTGRLLWAGIGRDRETVDEFFAILGPDRCAAITHVTADAAGWIAASVTANCPNAIRCADPFHIVAWATEAGGQDPPPGLEHRRRAPAR